MKKTITALVAATALTLTACGTSVYEEGAENLRQAGVDMDADTFKDYADSVCDAMRNRGEKPSAVVMDGSSKTIQMLGVSKREANLVVGASVRHVCPEAA